MTDTKFTPERIAELASNPSPIANVLLDAGWIVDRQSELGPIWIDVRSKSTYGYSYEGAFSELRRQAIESLQKELATVTRERDEARELLIQVSVSGERVSLLQGWTHDDAAGAYIDKNNPPYVDEFVSTLSRIRSLQTPPTPEKRAEPDWIVPSEAPTDQIMEMLTTDRVTVPPTKPVRKITFGYKNAKGKWYDCTTSGNYVSHLNIIACRIPTPDPA